MSSQLHLGPTVGPDRRALENPRHSIASDPAHDKASASFPMDHNLKRSEKLLSPVQDSLLSSSLSFSLSLSLLFSPSTMAPHLWLRAEVKANEHRTALTPDAYRELIAQGARTRAFSLSAVLAAPLALSLSLSLYVLCSAPHRVAAGVPTRLTTVHTHTLTHRPTHARTLSLSNSLTPFSFLLISPFPPFSPSSLLPPFHCLAAARLIRVVRLCLPFHAEKEAGFSTTLTSVVSAHVRRSSAPPQPPFAAGYKITVERSTDPLTSRCYPDADYEACVALPALSLATLAHRPRFEPRCLQLRALLCTNRDRGSRMSHNTSSSSLSLRLSALPPWRRSVGAGPHTLSSSCSLRLCSSRKPHMAAPAASSSRATRGPMRLRTLPLSASR